jgi:hypothetical protein
LGRTASSSAQPAASSVTSSSSERRCGGERASRRSVSRPSRERENPIPFAAKQCSGDDGRNATRRRDVRAGRGIGLKETWRWRSGQNRGSGSGEEEEEGGVTVLVRGEGGKEDDKEEWGAQKREQRASTPAPPIRLWDRERRCSGLHWREGSLPFRPAPLSVTDSGSRALRERDVSEGLRIMGAGDDVGAVRMLLASAMQPSSPMFALSKTSTRRTQKAA